MNLSSEAIERFLRSLSVNGKADNTVRAYRADLMGLWNWLDSPEGEIPDLEFRTKEYVTQGRKTWAPKTTNRKLAAFRAYGAYQGDTTFLSDYKGPAVAAGIAHPIQGGIPAVMNMYEKARRTEHKVMILLCGRLGLRWTSLTSRTGPS
jgi:site-specific recombinase XerD